MDYVCPQLLERNWSGKSDWHATITEHDHDTIRCRDCTFLRRVHVHASPFELSPHEAPSLIIPSRMHDCMGCLISGDCFRPLES